AIKVNPRRQAALADPRRQPPHAIGSEIRAHPRVVAALRPPAAVDLQEVDGGLEAPRLLQVLQDVVLRPRAPEIIPRRPAAEPRLRFPRSALARGNLIGVAAEQLLPVGAGSQPYRFEVDALARTNPPAFP